MDRVAQLAAHADVYIAWEKRRPAADPEVLRIATRVGLGALARSLGFPENEISSAIDTALKGR